MKQKTKCKDCGEVNEECPDCHWASCPGCVKRKPFRNDITKPFEIHDSPAGDTYYNLTNCGGSPYSAQVFGDSQPEAYTLALLFAASPALLAALNRLIYVVENPECGAAMKSALTQAKAAIAAAEGK